MLNGRTLSPFPAEAGHYHLHRLAPALQTAGTARCLARPQPKEAATIIASVEGLIWKIWILREEESEMGGMYLFANREAAEAYLKQPVIQAVCSLNIEIADCC
jgi:Putative mono-oxygenase ydhR